MLFIVGISNVFHVFMLLNYNCVYLCLFIVILFVLYEYCDLCVELLVSMYGVLLFMHVT